MWIKGKYKAWIDLSTYCNAACPQCPRTDPCGLDKIDWLDLIQWDLNTFKKIYPPDEMQKVLNFEICGGWGDPCMNKDMFKICEYIIKEGNSFITLNTNGSMRDEDWWWRLGGMCKDRINVVFTVDGINQKMHERYRRKTDLEKILNHMEILSSAGGKAEGFTVVFKHNQDYLKEIENLVKSYGATNHKWTKSDRFTNGKPFMFTNEKGDQEILEEATI